VEQRDAKEKKRKVNEIRRHEGYINRPLRGGTEDRERGERQQAYQGVNIEQTHKG